MEVLDPTRHSHGSGGISVTYVSLMPGDECNQGIPGRMVSCLRRRSVFRRKGFGGALGVAILMSGCAQSESDESNAAAASNTAQADVVATTASMSPPLDECRLVVTSAEYDYEPGAGGGEPSARDAVKRFVTDHAGGLPAGRDELLEGGTWRRVTSDGEVAGIFHVEPYASDEYYVTGFDRCVVSGG